jgi:pimeloyl-ACP methyl ester carboxylesterase
MAVLYAATYPDRTRALALFHPVTQFSESDKEESQADHARLRVEWGTQEFCNEMLSWSAPSLFESEEERLWFANWARFARPASLGFSTRLENRSG